MQTFIPVTTSFADMARLLDNKRLNKQALEAWQILMVLYKLNPDGSERIVKGWANHPAAKMWRGHEVLLNQYVQDMVVEWKARGYKSTIGDKANQTMQHAKLAGHDVETVTYPAWMLDTDLYELVAASHRVALLNKDYQWYSQHKWTEDSGSRPDRYTYIWPDIDGSYIVGEPRDTWAKV
jgi:hypothetical protein